MTRLDKPPIYRFSIDHGINGDPPPPRNVGGSLPSPVSPATTTNGTHRWLRRNDKVIEA
jgi:hypothetical protein